MAVVALAAEECVGMAAGVVGGAATKLYQFGKNTLHREEIVQEFEFLLECLQAEEMQFRGLLAKCEENGISLTRADIVVAEKLFFPKNKNDETPVEELKRKLKERKHDSMWWVNRRTEYCNRYVRRLEAMGKAKDLLHTAAEIKNIPVPPRSQREQEAVERGDAPLTRPVALLDLSNRGSATNSAGDGADSKVAEDGKVNEDGASATGSSSEAEVEVENIISTSQAVVLAHFDNIAFRKLYRDLQMLHADAQTLRDQYPTQFQQQSALRRERLIREASAEAARKNHEDTCRSMIEGRIAQNNQAIAKARVSVDDFVRAGEEAKAEETQSQIDKLHRQVEQMQKLLGSPTMAGARLPPPVAKSPEVRKYKTEIETHESLVKSLDEELQSVSNTTKTPSQFLLMRAEHQRCQQAAAARQQSPTEPAPAIETTICADDILAHLKTAQFPEHSSAQVHEEVVNFVRMVENEAVNTDNLAVSLEHLLDGMRAEYIAATGRASSTRLDFDGRELQNALTRMLEGVEKIRSDTSFLKSGQQQDVLSELSAQIDEMEDWSFEDEEEGKVG